MVPRKVSVAASDVAPTDDDRDQRPTGARLLRAIRDAPLHDVNLERRSFEGAVRDVVL